MSALPSTTQRRLLKLPQNRNIWEGDRRVLSGMGPRRDSSSADASDCIIWVDGSEGMVRAMDLVPGSTGMEAVVRTFLRAIEAPDKPSQPLRPHKILVRDRQLQFFLRGALQSLHISVDYVPELPLIDELFRRFENMKGSDSPSLPSSLRRQLNQVAAEIWQLQPWQWLADDDILEISFNKAPIDKVYACMLGMLGQEFGIILYRSKQSLRQFRAASGNDDLVLAEEAFLNQDCWFINFEDADDGTLSSSASGSPLKSTIHSAGMKVLFGSIHPYEGMRSLRDEEEARIVFASLSGILRFFEAHGSAVQNAFTQDFAIPLLEKRCRVSLKPQQRKETLQLTVRTQPDLQEELYKIDQEHSGELVGTDELILKDDLIPENAVLSIGMLPWDIIDVLRLDPKPVFQAQGEPLKPSVINQTDGLPIIMVQTSRPKAQLVIDRLQSEQSVTRICFNHGADSFSEVVYDLGIIETGAQSLYLFGEFIHDAPQHRQAREKWEHRCLQTQGRCGLVVAMGVTGKARGNPKLQHILALFEAIAISPDELGLGPMQLNLVPVFP